MNPIRIFAVEDDLMHQENLRFTLDELGYELAGMEESAEAALTRLPEAKPDLYLLDIQLSGKQDGIQLAHHIKTHWPRPLIYVTSYQDAPTFERARLTQPHAYLPKPLNPISLQASIESAFQQFAYPEPEPTPNWEVDVWMRDAFFVKVGKKLVKFSAAEVLWVEVSGNRYCRIVAPHKQAHVRASLAELHPKLAPHPFLRVHRSYLINARFIEAIHEAEQWVQVGEQQIPIGKSFRDSFMQQIRRL